MTSSAHGGDSLELWGGLPGTQQSQLLPSHTPNSPRHPTFPDQEMAAQRHPRNDSRSSLAGTSHMPNCWCSGGLVFQGPHKESCALRGPVTPSSPPGIKRAAKRPPRCCSTPVRCPLLSTGWGSCDAFKTVKCTRAPVLDAHCQWREAQVSAENPPSFRSHGRPEH